ncbi:MAG TPA: TonB-dependent receptor, partial [Opitutaceae bacterium]
VVVTLRRYDDWRDNGTAYQQNQLRQLLGSVALTGNASRGESWNVTAYVQGQQSAQTFSSVNAARTAETPASDQFSVPATALGLAASSTWTDSLGGMTTVGADARDIRGETREGYLYTAGSFSDQRFAGGRQTFAGLFAERSQPLGASIHAVAGLRLDRWEDSDGHLRSIAAASGALLSQTLYPTHTGTEPSPSAGLTWDATKRLQFHLSGQRAFRQPTLNELYRPFRQGNTTTLANAGLSTEHADSVELGGGWKGDGVGLTLSGFAARLEDPVSNVTVAQGPGTFPLFGTLPAGSIGQERLNLGRVDTLGVQLGLEWRLSESLSLILSAIDEEATVAAAAVAPALVGKQLPEVPRWNASLGASWHPLRPVHLEARVRHTGAQYDDDQNLLPLAPATVVDAALRVAVASHAEFFATVDNLWNARIETAHSALGVYNLAPPRTAGAGVRLSW